MKKVALITTNKILAQGLSAAIETMPELEFELFLLLNSKQALLDAEVLDIDIALIDGMDRYIKEKEISPSFCERLHRIMPNCHLLLLVPQDDRVSRKMAIEAKKNKVVDDFVFYDASLKYLFAKLSAF